MSDISRRSGGRAGEVVRGRAGEVVRGRAGEVVRGRAGEVVRGRAGEVEDERQAWIRRWKVEATKRSLGEAMTGLKKEVHR